ncbi:MAG: isocitrate lyase/PEP mutase family protein [Acidaminococcales bacterium]|jgi:carboxyvinyl-carboxyphosphonate phosphorylmutase|nr:isocitrate lyase/PEP mutase family protein [Acidaminococcales bacterium]
MKATTQLRKLLEKGQRGEILVAPGAHDALSARLVEAAGFNAVYLTGYGAAASLLGQPDVGLLTLSEMAYQARRFAGAVNIPVIADGDTGFGNAVNVQRAVREYEAAGVAAIQLEDQVAPKKCGHMLGREVVPAEEMAGKIQAAADARKDKDFVIVARTDARTDHGIEEAIRRGKLYEKAGADVLFIESPESEEEMKQITDSFDAPVLANMLEKGRTPLKSARELQAIGYAIVIFCVASTYVCAKAVMDYLQELKKAGTTERLIESKMLPFPEFNRFIGLDGIRAIEEKYGGAKSK